MSDKNVSYTKDSFNELNARVARLCTPMISTGFVPLDDLMDGFENGKVYVIGGRPCMGKEGFMMSMILDITLKSRLPVLLFSTNRRKSEYVQRLQAIHCDIPTMHLFKGLLEDGEWDRLDKKTGSLLDAQLC